MDCSRKIVIMVEIFSLCLFIFGCKGDQNNSETSETVAEEESIIPEDPGNTISGILGDIFYQNYLAKGPTGEPGPDGTIGPPDDVPGPDDPNVIGQGTGRGGVLFTEYPLAASLAETVVYAIPDLSGFFRLQNCPAGDHTLIIYNYGVAMGRRQIRITSDSNLDLGEIQTINADGIFSCRGFDGYRFSWEDENPKDGINDLFLDENGDGICDIIGRAYAHGYGWQDVDENGINDLFRDADGDGKNDFHSEQSYGFFFGYRDTDNDEKNDIFYDAAGDGINDVTGLEYSHGYGWQDVDENGINDLFTDVNGDGINEITGRSMMHGYQFSYIDDDEDGINDNFTDLNGDGICDEGVLCQDMPYAHGFGWQDENPKDGINDHFIDSDGDGINDLTGLIYSYGRNRYGFGAPSDEEDGGSEEEEEEEEE